MEDLFIEKNISPMLLYESKPFDSENFIFELKLDGFRCIAYLSKESVQLKSRNGKSLLKFFPELSNINKCVKEESILDGEIICLDGEGKSDFFALQSRARQKSKLKIDIMVKTQPVQFCVFDILYYAGKELINLPLMIRKKYLKDYVKERNGIFIARYISTRGKDFFELTQQQHLEGVVAKKKDSVYQIGKRSNNWLKMKVFCEDDVIICGYELKPTGEFKSALFGSYDKAGKFYIIGKVSLGTKPYEQTILFQPKAQPLSSHYPHMIWIQHRLVGTVQYLMKTKSGGFRHPVFKGVRKDKTVADIKKRNKEKE